MASKTMDRIRPRRKDLKRRQEWTHDLRPRCLQNNETYLHVLQCPAETSRTQ